MLDTSSYSIKSKFQVQSQNDSPNKTQDLKQKESSDFQQPIKFLLFKPFESSFSTQKMADQIRYLIAKNQRIK
jgi:HJR/Mrr/RecB family endonuclease